MQVRNPYHIWFPIKSLFYEACMKTCLLFLLGLVLLVPFQTGFPTESRVEISCGQKITENTTLAEDLACGVVTNLEVDQTNLVKNPENSTQG
jgi:hypothetical protein